MDFDILTWQQITLILLVASIWLFAVFRRIAPGFPGIARGPHQLNLYYADRFYDELAGNLVDCTDVLLSKDLQLSFIDFIKQFMPEHAKAIQNSEVDLGNQKAILRQATQETAPIKNLTVAGDIRVIVNGVRTITSKHLFVTFLDRNAVFPDAYLSVKERSSLNIFTFDWMNKGLINGWKYDLPGKWKLPAGIGKVQIHLLVPIPKKDNPIPLNLQAVSDYAKMVIHIKTTMDAQQLVKQIEKRLVESEKEKKSLRQILSAFAVHNDSLRAALAGFQTKEGGKLPTTSITSERRLRDAILYIGSTLGAGLLTFFLGVNPIIGCAIGVFSVALWIMWRG